MSDIRLQELDGIISALEDLRSDLEWNRDAEAEGAQVTEMFEEAVYRLGNTSRVEEVLRTMPISIMLDASSTDNFVEMARSWFMEHVV